MIDNGTKEIDLSKVFRNLLYQIFKNLNKIILFFLLWSLLFVVLFVRQKNHFRVVYYISSDFLSGQKIELILSDVKNLIEQNKYKELSNLLNVPITDLKKVVSLKTSPAESDIVLSSNLSSSPGLDDPAEFYFNETNTEIRFVFNDTLNVNQLVDALNNFISGSSYFKKFRKNERLMMDMLNRSLEDQKNVLDSINKINISKFMNPSSDIIFANDISEIKRNIYFIEERLIKNNRLLVRFEDPINLINYPILKKDSFLLSFSRALLKSFFLTISIWLVWFIWHKLSYQYRRYKQTV
jgi:hypothetical protein